MKLEMSSIQSVFGKTLKILLNKATICTAAVIALLSISIPSNNCSPVSPAKHLIASFCGTVAFAAETGAVGKNTNGGQNTPPANGVKPSPSVTPGPATGTTTKYGAKLAKLRLRVIDGRTQKPIEGAEIVIVENEQRYKTGADGYTPWFLAPVIRQPKFVPVVQELHGQLSAIAYKDGYRDSIHMGIRMEEGIENQNTIWMYKIGPGDFRVEPVLYQEPYHHIWLIELADRFRNKSQLGEGFQKP